mmetsp:Transcript_98366/g.194999  ORF Transcript_98366/g.194999 Transcript_98366/m.194999 type:complete len:490 (+) Transcript_98366:101-1570(+)
MRRLHFGHRVFAPILLALIKFITATPTGSEGGCRHAGSGAQLSKKCTRSASKTLPQDFDYSDMPAPSPSMVQRVKLPKLTKNMDVDEEGIEVLQVAGDASPPPGFWRHGLAVVQNISFPRGGIRLLQDLRMNLSSIRKEMHKKFATRLGLQMRAQRMQLVALCILLPSFVFAVLALAYCINILWGNDTRDVRQNRYGSWQTSVPSRSGHLKPPTQSRGVPGTGVCEVPKIAQLPSAMTLLNSPRRLSMGSSVNPGGASPERSARGKISTVPSPPGMRPLTAHATPRSLARSSSRKYLCPELVVPEHNECTLQIPDLNLEAPNGILSIDDVNSSAVLLTSYSLLPNPPKAPYEVPGSGKRLVLRSALEDVVVASCRDADPGSDGSLPGLTILNCKEEVCGMLRPSGPDSKNSYVVALWSGQKVLVRKDVQANCTYATDEDGWMLACIEEELSDHKRLLRISPQVDAGLITLTMLGTRLLELGVVAAMAKK